MVSDPLIAGKRLDLEALPHGIPLHVDIGRDIHYIAVGCVRHMIQQILPFLHTAESGIFIIIKLLDTGIVVVHGCLSHMEDQLARLVQGQNRVGDQVHIQFPDALFQLQVFDFLLGFVRNDPFCQRGKKAREGKEDHGRDQTEGAVNIGNAAGIQLHVPEIIA